MKTSTTVLIIAILVIAAGIAFSLYNSKSNKAARGDILTSITYACAEGKTISADYYEHGSSVVISPDEPPVDAGSVDIKLSDGRELSLPQTLSASGTRYANADESLVFWSKGNTAFVLEGDIETYSDCVSVE